MSTPATSPGSHRDGRTTASYHARMSAAEKAANPLLEAARPLLDALQHMPVKLDANGVAQHRQWLVHEVRMFGKVCAGVHLPAQLVDRARYCLCSALDEAASRTVWGKGSASGADWESDGLCATFGYDRQGADRVFAIAAEAMGRPYANFELLEVLQGILAHGFQGRYRFSADGERQLVELRERAHSAVTTGAAYTRQAHGHAASSVRYVPLRRQMADIRTRAPVRRKARSWLAVSALCVSLLAIIGCVALWRFTHMEPAAAAVAPVDTLAPRLTGQFADQMNAGTLSLTENAAHTALTLRLEGIFDAGGSTVNPWVEPMIATIGQEIAKTPGHVLVTGHTDDQPFERSPRDSNLALSAARAQEVAGILASAGVPIDRMRAIGKGNTEPVADNATTQGRMKNRRVEIFVSE